MPLTEDLKNANEEQFIRLLEDNPTLCDTPIPVKYGFYSPAHLAAHHGWLNALEVLKKLGAKMDEQAFETIKKAELCFQTPLHLAVLHRHTACVDFLLNQCKANPNKQDFWGKTPLFQSFSLDLENNETEETTLEIIKLFLNDKRTNLNIMEDTDEGGDTPLHAGVRSNHLQGVRLLILNGAHQIPNTEEGMTPLQLAEKLHLFEMQNTIRNALSEKRELFANKKSSSYPSQLSLFGARENKVTGPKALNALKKMASLPKYTAEEVACQAYQFTLWAKTHDKHFHAKSMKEIRATFLEGQESSHAIRT